MVAGFFVELAVSVEQWHHCVEVCKSGLADVDVHKFPFMANCRIPDDCIDEKRYPLFMGRAMFNELIESLQATGVSSLLNALHKDARAAPAVRAEIAASSE